jgi:glycosyltransferase involved in cell wall biosynthesis
LLSIIIPTLNESQTGYLPKIFDAYHKVPGIEIICVDGGSTDSTISLIKQSTARLIATDVSSRAGRLNAGIAQSKFEMVLLHHPRSLVNIEGIMALANLSTDNRWGAFTHQFSISHPLLDFTSWYSNYIRGGLRSIYYLDHCIFAQKQLLLDVGLLPDIDIFEDTEICLRLKKQGKPIRLPFISQTSAVRFQVQGIYQQALKNQYLKWLYYFNRSDTKMNRLYEKGLELNTKYEKKKNHK